MAKTVHYKIVAGHCLLVSGSVSFQLISGKAHIFFAELNPNEQVIIHEGRRVPIEAYSDSIIDVLIGSSGCVEKINNTCIPASWTNILPSISRSIEREERILIIGGIDSGKNSLSTLIVNHLLLMDIPIRILDLDLGQSEIGIPTTIGIGNVSQPIIGIYQAELKAQYFLGSLTPAPVIDRVFTGIQALISITGKRKGVLIINTDGWTEGDEAQDYKLRLVKTVKPDITIIIDANDMFQVIKRDQSHQSILIQVEKSPFIYRRSREERKHLREQTYYQYFKRGELRTYPLSKVNWRDLNVEEIPIHNINLLVGLLGKEGIMKGPGILKNIDKKADKVTIFSCVSTNIYSIDVGKVRIREDGKELEHLIY